MLYLHVCPLSGLCLHKVLQIDPLEDGHILLEKDRRNRMIKISFYSQNLFGALSVVVTFRSLFKRKYTCIALFSNANTLDCS